MHVILDTNVFVAAGFNPRSHSALLLDAVRAGALRMTWHRATRDETRRMLQRIPRLSWQTCEALFRPEDEFAGDLDLARYGFVEDVDDRKFAALAEVTRCPIVTSDDDLLSVKDALAVPVLTPREFVDAHPEVRDNLGRPDHE